MPKGFFGMVDFAAFYRGDMKKRITCTVTDPHNEEQLSEMLRYLGKVCNGGHAFSVRVDPGDPKNEKDFGFDGDGGLVIGDVSTFEIDDEEEKKRRASEAKKAEKRATQDACTAYFGKETEHMAMDKAATRDKGGCFDDTRTTYTGEALLAVLSMIENFGAFHDCWDKFEPWRKQEFKDAQRAAADYVRSISKENLCNPSDFKYRKR